MLDRESVSKAYPCVNCGSELSFDIESQSLLCRSCGSSRNIGDQDKAVTENDLIMALERQESKLPKVTVIKVSCGSCSAYLEFDPSVKGANCGYCGASLEIKGGLTSERIPPDAVLPFQVDKRQADRNLDAWVKKRWFAPSDFKQTGTNGKLEGTNLPFFTFDSLTYSQYSGSRGEDYTVEVGQGDNRRTETRTKWTPVSGHVIEDFDDVLVFATNPISEHLIERLQPWPLDQAKPFHKDYVTGKVFLSYASGLRECFGEAKLKMREAIAHSVKRDIGGDRQSIDRLETQHEALTYKHVVLPVWLMAYRYKNKAYHVAVNAVTGEVSGSRPYSTLKIVGAFLAFAAISGFAYYLGRRTA